MKCSIQPPHLLALSLLSCLMGTAASDLSPISAGTGTKQTDSIRQDQSDRDTIDVMRRETGAPYAIRLPTTSDVLPDQFFDRYSRELGLTDLEGNSSGDVFFPYGDNMVLLLTASQSRVWSPTGAWEFRGYDEHGCDDLLHAVVHPQNTVAVGNYGYEDKGSFKVRVHGDYGAFHVGEPDAGWSDCQNFTTVTKAEQRRKNYPPPDPPAGSEISKCDDWIEWGSNDPEQHVVMLDKQIGHFVLRYNTFVVPDKIEILHDGLPIFPGVCKGTNGEASTLVSFDGVADWVLVRVEPNCSGTPYTEWEILIECPWASAVARNASPISTNGWKVVSGRKCPARRPTKSTCAWGTSSRRI